MPTGSPQSRRALRIGAAASVSRYRRSVGQAGSSPYPGRSIAITERLPRAAGYDAQMWRLESEPCTKTIGPVTVSAACDEECVSYMTGPARYGSREAPVVSRLGTTLAARRSLEGDLKVVLSFPGFDGERAWKWFRARNVALCRAGRVLLSRASRPIRSSLDSSLRLRLSSTRRQHSGRSGVLASLRSWSPRLGQRAYAAGSCRSGSRWRTAGARPGIEKAPPNVARGLGSEDQPARGNVIPVKFRARAAQAARLVLNAGRTKPVGVQALNGEGSRPIQLRAEPDDLSRGRR